ncbi:MAG: DUF6913 domain-containing protein [Bacteroidales bacterium]
MFQALRHRIIHFLIDRELKRTHRQRAAISLNGCQHVGILFSLDNEEMYRRINSLIYRLTEEKKQVRAMGLLPGKTVPNYYLAKLKIDLIGRKDINLLGIPTTGAVKEFMEAPFDILLDFSISHQPALDYIAGMSKAAFKTGSYREEMVKVYDFMIKMPEQGTFNQFYDSMLAYLTSLNTSRS